MNQSTYSVSQAAKFIGVPASTLRYWERQGLFSPDRNPGNSYREYSLYELIAAADISFLRQLGLSLEEVRRYGRSEVEEMEEMLSSAQRSVDERIEELKRMARRLEEQRRSCRIAVERKGCPLEASEPDFPMLFAADYARAEHWRFGIEDPRRYGIMVEKDGFLADGLVLIPGDEEIEQAFQDMDVLWVRNPEKAYWCGLLTVAMNGEGTDAERLFDEAKALGMDPERVVGRLLVTVPGDNEDRMDVYLAWVECRV